MAYFIFSVFIILMILSAILFIVHESASVAVSYEELSELLRSSENPEVRIYIRSPIYGKRDHRRRNKGNNIL